MSRDPTPSPFSQEVVLEFGLYSFAETSPDSGTGRRPTAEQRLRDLLEEIELFGTEVVPKVRAEIARRESAAR